MADIFKATLSRISTGDSGTFGLLSIESAGSLLIVSTAELPWRDNKRNVSCIPLGTYRCEEYRSSKYGRCYRVNNVPGRDGILIHVGNWAGDKSKGYKSDSSGCILVGTEKGTLEKQRAVFSSKKARDLIFKFTDGASFDLTVKNSEDFIE